MRFSIVSLLAASALAVNGAATTSRSALASRANPAALAIDVERVSFSGKKTHGEIVAGQYDEEDDVVTDADAVSTRAAGATAAIGSALGGAVMDVATGVAVNIITEILQAVIEWTKARETFTQAMTDEMWAQNPEPGKYHAAICYNKGYGVADWNGIAGLAKVTLRLNVLHTDYDCMYMSGPNQFWTASEGGYINLSYTYDRNHCSFDGKTGDLTCW
ncbi:hypothetical protein CkaCkLH20_11316 [Colletotrichum karsti]|uniref:DUF7888 domain-containing protein n=1 Tax=Colletotrichum karsti TaxID=1095194 RepID=A0A9P6HW86_9PEZI|nr:uncharacterized protein CkaCkLH20_11316 [Colletotrichum karsti]KAF9871147.1 hypothetical protein CkaCkLH20_11316 [Colletotrichum karsti]